MESEGERYFAIIMVKKTDISGGILLSPNKSGLSTTTPDVTCVEKVWATRCIVSVLSDPGEGWQEWIGSLPPGRRCCKPVRKLLGLIYRVVSNWPGVAHFKLMENFANDVEEEQSRFVPRRRPIGREGRASRWTNEVSP